MQETSIAAGRERRKKPLQFGVKKEASKGKAAWPVIEPYLYLMPAFLIFFFFVYFPFFKTIYMSFHLTNIVGKAVEFIGFENYQELFSSPDFQNSLLVTLKFVVLTSVPAILGGLALALMAQRKTKGTGALRVMYAMPMAVSTACAAVIWMLLYHPTIGSINYLLGKQIAWLSDPDYALAAVAIVTAWMQIGFNFILLLAGLQGIPKEYYESAAIDGAGYLQTLWKITLPSLSPTLFFVIVVNVIEAFQAFGQVNIMTAGGPANSTNVVVYTIYQQAFLNNRFGLASASSIILFFIMLVVTIIQFRYEKKLVFYK
ncbi:MAG: carbohydrate ABC transporter permease [Ectobacillus sp.]